MAKKFYFDAERCGMFDIETGEKATGVGEFVAASDLEAANAEIDRLRLALDANSSQSTRYFVDDGNP